MYKKHVMLDIHGYLRSSSLKFFLDSKKVCSGLKWYHTVKRAWFLESFLGRELPGLFTLNFTKGKNKTSFIYNH